MKLNERRRIIIQASQNFGGLGPPNAKIKMNYVLRSLKGEVELSIFFS
jgi:hypothetical protein